MPFSKLGLSDALVRAVAEQGYTEPTPIQAQAIPAVLAGGDLLAGAQTGTGKTAGFVLPMLQRLSTQPSPHKSHGARKPLRALILTPTRELAAQIEESIRVYGKHVKVSSMTLFGGVGFAPQTAQLKRGVDILVATPGRLLDHQGQGNVDFSYVEIFVLDEADRMLDMGFIPDVKRVLALLPKKRQNLLFSATFSDEIKALADRLLDHPQTIEVAPRNSTVDAIAQRMHPVDRDRKRELLSHLISHNRWQQVLVFTRTKHGADKLARALESDGIRTVALHGNKSQGARTRALADFKDGDVTVLVATDIAARGIDIDQLPHVVNYDLPNVPEDYVHRIGRTGRAGAEGEAISLVCIDERDFLRDIERLIKREIPVAVIAGFEPDPKAVAQPVFAKGGPGRGRPQQQGRGNPRGQPAKQRASKPSQAPGAARGQGARNAGNEEHRRAPSTGNVNAPAGGRARPSSNGSTQQAKRVDARARDGRQGSGRVEANGNAAVRHSGHAGAEANGNVRHHAHGASLPPRGEGNFNARAQTPGQGGGHQRASSTAHSGVEPPSQARPSNGGARTGTQHGAATPALFMRSPAKVR
jgi:ATP-dependent RNA helicase RhlE